MKNGRAGALDGYHLPSSGGNWKPPRTLVMSCPLDGEDYGHKYSSSLCIEAVPECWSYHSRPDVQASEFDFAIVLAIENGNSTRFIKRDKHANSGWRWFCKK